MKAILVILCSFPILSINAQQSRSIVNASPKAKQIDSFMSLINKSGQFMGAVLVAENGKLIYKKGFGFADTRTKEKFTTSTPCYIGSVSKQFTALGIVSTVEDLYKWDKMLDKPTIISEQSLIDIFTGGKNDWQNDMYGKQSYGFGWFISGHENDKVAQHDGGFAGFRSYIERQANKHNTIIFISNVRHELIGKIREGIVNIMDNRPFTIPQTSWANWIISRSKDVGIEQAILNYKAMSGSKDSSKYYFSERECNSLGYYLLRNSRIADAIQLFILNTEQFPKSGNVFDSLGEAYQKIGDKEKALASYKRAFELDPNNSNAANLIKQLQGGQ